MGLLSLHLPEISQAAVISPQVNSVQYGHPSLLCMVIDYMIVSPLGHHGPGMDGKIYVVYTP